MGRSSAGRTAVPMLIAAVLLATFLSAEGGTLKVTLVRAEVQNQDSGLQPGRTDTEVDIWVPGHAGKQTSRDIGDDDTPRWNQVFDFGSSIPASATVNFEAFDKDSFIASWRDKFASGSFPASPSGPRTVTDGRNTFYFQVEFTPYNPCTTLNGECGSNSRCIFEGVDNQRRCECESGYFSPSGSGTDCDWINPCTTDNGGCGDPTVATCVNTGPNERACGCIPGYATYTGHTKDCEPRDLCKEFSPCGAHAKCEPAGNGYLCNCVEGYIRANGRDCVPENSCEVNNGGCGELTCFPTGTGSSTCECGQDQDPVQDNCIDVDYCENDPCGENTQCFSEVGTHRCECLPDHEPESTSPTLSCKPINACETVTCDSSSTCVSTGPGTFECQCAEGYERQDENAAVCEPINACLAGPCGGNSGCSPTGPGTFTCRCIPGYASPNDDGSNCQPINPCELDSSLCGGNGTCVFAGPNAYTCNCSTGFRVSQENICSPIDRCAEDPTPCPESSRCEYNGPGLYSCECEGGYRHYSLNGVPSEIGASFITGTCDPIDVCAQDPNVCGPNTVCNSTGPGTFNCSCQAGSFKGNQTDLTIILSCQVCSACHEDAQVLANCTDTSDTVCSEPAPSSSTGMDRDTIIAIAVGCAIGFTLIVLLIIYACILLRNRRTLKVLSVSSAELTPMDSSTSSRIRVGTMEPGTLRSLNTRPSLSAAGGVISTDQEYGKLNQPANGAGSKPLRAYSITSQDGSDTIQPCASMASKPRLNAYESMPGDDSDGSTATYASANGTGRSDCYSTAGRSGHAEYAEVGDGAPDDPKNPPEHVLAMYAAVDKKKKRNGVSGQGSAKDRHEQAPIYALANTETDKGGAEYASIDEAGGRAAGAASYAAIDSSNDGVYASPKSGNNTRNGAAVDTSPATEGAVYATPNKGKKLKAGAHASPYDEARPQIDWSPGYNRLNAGKMNTQGRRFTESSTGDYDVPTRRRPASYMEIDDSPAITGESSL